MGYIWLTDDDARTLMGAGQRIVRVNPPQGPRFIDSYTRDATGKVTVQTRSPKCPFLDSAHRCSIHQQRPLVCRLYPLALETLSNGAVAWVLHRNCNHVRKISADGKLDELLTQVRRVINAMSPEFAADLLTTYFAVNAVTEWISPADEREVTIVLEVRSAKGSSADSNVGRQL
ncbi:YkgJ family cysteine cluster protein [Sinorhizobium meliloti]|uniref:YkgJ family cysteine cluster protein n=1 Tax=Rhizobium meliloti TaxID=382 RepID=UPI000485E8E0|nr:YkgJ family cysteine cluster protein [Sinorhizobium meliloti]